MTNPPNSDRAFDEAHALDTDEEIRERIQQRQRERDPVPFHLRMLAMTVRGDSGVSTDSPRVTVEETPQGRIVTYHKTAADAAAARDETDSNE